MSRSAETMSVYASGVGMQETLTGEQVLSVTCYHSKVYTTDSPCVMKLGRGVQRGQLKKISFVHKGLDGADVTIHCSNLKHGSTRIIMSKKGDQIELVWLGGTWAVLSTLNYENFMSPSPTVL